MIDGDITCGTCVSSQAEALECVLCIEPKADYGPEKSRGLHCAAVSLEHSH